MTDNYTISEVQLPLIFGLAGHNFLVLKDENGNVVDQINGLATSGDGKSIKPIGYLPSDKLIVYDSKDNTAATGDYNNLNGDGSPVPINMYSPSESQVVLATGTQAEMNALWDTAKAAGNEINGEQLSYPFLGLGANSNSVASTLIASIGLAEPEIPDSALITPGVGTLLLTPTEIQQIQRQNNVTSGVSTTGEDYVSSENSSSSTSPSITVTNGDGTDSVSTFSMNASGAGVADLKEYNTNGNLEYEQIDATDSTGKTSVNVTGNGDFIDIGNANITLAPNSAATLAGLGDTVIAGNGDAITLGSAIGGDTVATVTTYEQLSYNITATIDVPSGEQVTIKGTDGTMVADNAYNGSTEIQNTVDWNTGGSQIQSVNPDATTSAEFANFSGADGNGTLNSATYTWATGGSQEHIYIGLADGVSERILNYTDAYGTGTLVNETSNYTAGGSLEEWLSPSSTVAAEFDSFSGLYATGMKSRVTYDWITGGSQEDIYTGIPKGTTEQILNYTDADDTGTLLNETSNYAVGGSLEKWLAPFEGVTSEVEYFSDAFATGAVKKYVLDMTDGTSQERLFSGLPSSIAEVEFDYADPDATGALDERVIDYTGGNSVLDVFDPAHNVANEFEYFTGSDGAGTLSKNILNMSDGTSEEQLYGGLPSSILEEVFDYAGVNATGALSDRLIDYAAGNSVLDLIDPSDGVSSEFEYFTGANESGAETKAISNLTDSTSQVELFDPSSGISTEIESFSGLNGTGNDTRNILDLTDGTSQEQLFTDLDASVSEVINAYSGLDATGTLDNAIFDQLDGTSRMVSYDGLPSGTADTITFYADANGTGVVTKKIVDWASGGSQEQVLTDLSAGEKSETDNYSGTAATGTLETAVLDLTDGRSEVRSFVNLQPGTTELIQDYTDTDGTGTLIDDIYNLTAGGSAQQTFVGLSTDVIGEIDYYAGANATGSLNSTILDISDGTSEVHKFSGLSPNESELIQVFSAADGTGTLTEDIYDLTNGGSQEHLFAGLDGGVKEQIANYSGANATGTVKSALFDRTDGTSQEQFFTDLPAGDAALIQNFSGPKGSGNLLDELQNLTNGYSLVNVYDPTIPGVTQYVAEYTGANETGDVVAAEFLLQDGEKVESDYYYNASGVETGYVDSFYDSSSDYLGDASYNSNGDFTGGSDSYSSDVAYGDDVYDYGDDGFDYSDYSDYGFATLSDGSSSTAAGAQLRQSQSITGGSPNLAILENASWGNIQTITWSFAATTDVGRSGLHFSGLISTPQEQEAVTHAVQQWVSASGLTLEEVPDSGQVDIRIGWGEFDTASSGVVGNTTYTSKNGLFDPNVIVRLEDPFQDPLSTSANGAPIYLSASATLEQVALHEIGHALGLADNVDPTSAMYYQVSQTNQRLDAIDVGAIRALTAGGNVTSFGGLPETMTFLGGSAGNPSTVTALPNEAFTIEDGANSLIRGFSAAAGDTLNLTAILGDVSPDLLDFAHINEFVTIAGPIADGSDGWITDVAINGPGGHAVVGIDSPTQVSTIAQLYPALTLPLH